MENIAKFPLEKTKILALANRGYEVFKNSKEDDNVIILWLAFNVPKQLIHQVVNLIKEIHDSK
jgi:hypothetical protein